MKRRALLSVVVLVAVLCGLFYWNRGAEARRWEGLLQTRKKIVLTRKLVSFEQFLWNRMYPVSLTYGRLFDTSQDNESHIHGTLLLTEPIGKLTHRFYYHDWDSEPSSQEIHFIIEPAHVAKFGTREMQTLIAQTKKEGDLRTTFCDMQWFSYFDEKGNLDLTWRLAYPSRWMEDVPEYNRGFSDEMFFEVSMNAIRYLFREVFVDKETRLELGLPHFNTPNHVRHNPVGTVHGLIFPKKGPPVGLEIGTSQRSLWPHNVTLHIDIRSRHEQVRQLIKPNFLNKKETAVGGVTTMTDERGAELIVRIWGPIEAIED